MKKQKRKQKLSTKYLLYSSIVLLVLLSVTIIIIKLNQFNNTAETDKSGLDNTPTQPLTTDNTDDMKDDGSTDNSAVKVVVPPPKADDRGGFTP